MAIADFHHGLAWLALRQGALRQRPVPKRFVHAPERGVPGLGVVAGEHCTRLGGIARDRIRLGRLQLARHTVRGRPNAVRGTRHHCVCPTHFGNGRAGEPGIVLDLAQRIEHRRGLYAELRLRLRLFRPPPPGFVEAPAAHRECGKHSQFVRAIDVVGLLQRAVQQRHRARDGVTRHGGLRLTEYQSREIGKALSGEADDRVSLGDLSLLQQPGDEVGVRESVVGISRSRAERRSRSW